MRPDIAVFGNDRVYIAAEAGTRGTRAERADLGNVRRRHPILTKRQRLQSSGGWRHALRFVGAPCRGGCHRVAERDPEGKIQNSELRTALIPSCRDLSSRRTSLPVGGHFASPTQSCKNRPRTRVKRKTAIYSVSHPVPDRTEL